MTAQGVCVCVWPSVSASDLRAGVLPIARSSNWWYVGREFWEQFCSLIVNKLRLKWSVAYSPRRLAYSDYVDGTADGDNVRWLICYWAQLDCSVVGFFVQLLSAVDTILPHAPATVFNELYPSPARLLFVRWIGILVTGPFCGHFVIGLTASWIIAHSCTSELSSY